MTNGEVLFTIILSSLFFGERPHGKAGMFAIGLVVAGLFMATTNMKFSETIIEFNAGNLLILASMSMWAVDNNISRRLTTFSTISPSKIAMIKSLFGGLVILGIALALGKWGAIASIQPDLWLIIVVMAVSGFGAALLFFLEGIKRIGTIKTMSVFSMVPIFGIAIAAITLGESISIFQADRDCTCSDRHTHSQPALEQLQPVCNLVNQLGRRRPYPYAGSRPRRYLGEAAVVYLGHWQASGFLRAFSPP